MTPALAAYYGLTALAAPFLLVRSQKGLPRGRRRERFGIASVPAQQGLVWVSAASVGELRAVLPLLPALGPTLVTTQTTTAAAIAAEEGLLHQFTPIDTPAATTAFLRTWRPKAAVFVESEVPPRMIARLARIGIPATLIGARASKTRDRLPKSMTEILSRLSVITASTPEVERELTAMGLPVAATEDLKAGTATKAVSPDLLVQWNTIRQRPIWLAASTHPGDEERILRAHRSILSDHPDALLCLAPRHPDRSAEVLDKIDLPVTRQSAGDVPSSDTQVHLIDTMGDLPLFYTLCPVTLLGGSFDTLGGHTPFEPARYGSHVLTGPDVAHHLSAFAEVPHTVTSPRDLARAVQDKWKTQRPAPIAPMSATKTRDALLQMIDAVPR
ncbi:3-deoxy-D-manno-octulosonic acid transferase [Shimia ponticola]|uniref:3-deoxy-D-manno-octulosonic acid transferase n=1 Tax=Shimia ponticola TaxID=2582893 RepID=UPI0011BD8030|nr:glycosyltransferase N-terminal domain-containing protein [Shimia ponticola]